MAGSTPSRPDRRVAARPARVRRGRAPRRVGRSRLPRDDVDADERAAPPAAGADDPRRCRPRRALHLWAFEGIHSDVRGRARGRRRRARGGRPRRPHAPRRRPHRRRPRRHGPEGSTLAFPNARIAAPAAGIAPIEAGEGLPVGIEERKEWLAAMRGHGVLDLFEPGELAEGVTARSAPGHRAGHVCVEVGGEHPLVHIADTLHHHAHIEHPEWDGPADDDRALALDTRRAVLAGLRETGTRASPPTSPASSRFRELPHHPRGRASPLHGARRGQAHGRARARLEGLPPACGTRASTG